VNPVVVWDEVFGWNRLKHAFQEILGMLPKFYSFDGSISLNALAFHVDGKTEVGATISNFLSDTLDTVGRIALVDVQSCGLSRIEWRHIIPHLRAHYDFVLGFAHYPGKGRC
jgi:hypothetical protein